MEVEGAPSGRGRHQKALAVGRDVVPKALRTLGAQRIGIVTPFLREANRNVATYFSALGLSVVSAVGSASGRFAESRALSRLEG